MNETEYLKNFESFGVRYITYDLIQKLCKKDFHLVETLNLNLVNDTNKKFKYFEKLEKLTNLKKLNISFNIIEKIDNIKNLTNLTHLNLSFNKISKIENLEHLILLKNLNLNHNNIETIPTWFQKKLSHLNVFTLCHNRIESIDEIRKLHLLSNLTHVGFVGNAISILSHYQSFVLVHLRNITKLDSKEISDKEKTRDVALYNNEAIMNCEKEISKYKQAYLELDESFTLLKEKMRIKNYKTNSTQNFEMLRKNEKLIEDLKNKEIELKEKNIELSKAYSKIYNQEQQLALKRIDKMFPNTSSDENDSYNDNAYIGKYRKYGYLENFNNKNEYSNEIKNLKEQIEKLTFIIQTMTQREAQLHKEIRLGHKLNKSDKEEIIKMIEYKTNYLNEMQRKNDEAISKMQVLNMKIKNGENKKNININDSNKLKLNFNIEKCKHNLYKSVIEHESQICQKLENSLDGEKLPNWYDSTFNELPNLFNQLYYQINEWQNYIQKLHTTDPIMKSISVQTPKYQDTEMKKIAQIEKLNQELTNKNMEIYKLRENIMNMNKTFTNENIHNEVTKSKKNVKIQCKMEKSIHKKSIAVMTSFKKPDSEIADLSCQDSMKRYDDMKKIYKSLTPTEKIHFIKLQKEISDLKEMFQEDDVEKIKNINQTKNCINQLLGVIESNDSNSSCVSSNFQSKKKSTSTSQLKSTLKSLGSNKTKVKINKQLIETLDSMLRERNDDLVEIKSMMNNKLKNKYNKVSTNPKVFNQYNLYDYWSTLFYSLNEFFTFFQNNSNFNVHYNEDSVKKKHSLKNVFKKFHCEKDKFDNLLDEFSSNLKTTDSKYIL